MKKIKKSNIFFLILFLIAAVGFSLYAAGYESDYIKNYARNFKTNLYVFSVKLGLPQEAIDAVPTPEPVVPTPTPLPTATPIVPFENQNIKRAMAIEKSIMIPVQNSANMKYVVCGGKLFCVDKTAITIMSKRGQELHKDTVQLSEPIVRSAGNYVMAADKGGRRVYMYDGTKLLYDVDTEGDIISADVSENGDIIIVCSKEYYKGGVVVYNKNGDMVYSWSSGNDRIIDADISGQSRNIAIVTMSVDGSSICSNILACAIDSEKLEPVAKYPDKLIFDAEFYGNELMIIGDDMLAGLNGRGKQIWQNTLENSELIIYDMGECLAGVFDMNDRPYVKTINSAGKEKGSMKMNMRADYIDINNGIVAYNEDRNLVVTDISAKANKSFSCMRDMNGLYIMDKDTAAVIYSSSIEFIDIR